MPETWFKPLQVFVAIVIALLGLAASWGATRAEAASAKTELNVVKDRQRELELKEASQSAILQRIAEDLKEVKEDIKDIKEKLP